MTKNIPVKKRKKSPTIIIAKGKEDYCLGSCSMFTCFCSKYGVYENFLFS